MSQSQPDLQLVLVVENPDLVVPAVDALVAGGGTSWIELNDCATAAAWLNGHQADLVLVLLKSAALGGLDVLRTVWQGPLLCFCDEDAHVLDVVEAHHAFAVFPPFGARQIIHLVRMLAYSQLANHLRRPIAPSQDISPARVDLTLDHNLQPRGPEVASLRENERRLEQAQRMEAVGRLAGGIAHDFNNLLTVIGSYSDLATRKLEDGHVVLRYVEQIRKASATAATLTRQLLAFSRRQVLQPRVIALNEIVDEISFMVQSLLGAGIELRMKLASDLLLIEADPVQLQQVLLNLIVNAKDAMPDGGLLNIETKNFVLDQRYSAQFTNVQPGQYVRLTVSDTGIGMDTATLSRIYEPFFTTKPKGRGTGLGLPTVYGIVQQSGGYISVYSEVGKGTTFHVFLPSVEKALTPEGEREESRDELTGRETILLIEDETGVRELASLVLREAGYHVLTAPTPEEALTLELGHEGVIDLLLTDVIMPRMTGREVAVRLAQRRPHTPVVYMSGYTEDVMAFQQLLDIGAYLIEKPFYPTDLLRIVRRAIDQPAGHEVSKTTLKTLT